MADPLIPKRSPPVAVPSALAAPRGGSHKTSAADVALRSLAHLQDSESRSPGAALKRGVVAALLGIALIGGVTPAHADTTLTTQPQAKEMFLAGQQPTGPAGYARVLGTVTTPQKQLADARTKAAFDSFEARVAQLLHRDAGSLADGLVPFNSGDKLDAAQQKSLERALSDLIKELPVSAFSEDLQRALKPIFGGRDIASMRLGDLGKLGTQAALDLVDRLPGDKTLWSIGGAAAAATLAIGYPEGTAALAKLGIRPKASITIFKDVKLKAGIDDGRAGLGLDGQHTFAGGTILRGGIAAQLGAQHVVTTEVRGGVSTLDGLSIAGRVRLDGGGQPFDARLSMSQTFTHDLAGGGSGTAYGEARWANGTQGTSEQSSLSVGLSTTHGRWTSTVGTSYDFRSDRFSTSLSAGRLFDIRGKNDLELQLRGGVDSGGGARIGVGVAWRF